MNYNDLKDYEVYALIVSGNMSEEEFLNYICNLHVESYDSGYEAGIDEGRAKGYRECLDNNAYRFE